MICPFCAKSITFDPKEYRGVIFYNTEESCKVWHTKKWWETCRGIGLLFQNWHKEIDKFRFDHSKISKISSLTGCFLGCFSLKIDTKKKWFALRKMTWGIWKTFTRPLERLKIGTLMASICLQLKIYELKICKGVMCHENEEWCKNWRGIDLPVQNWHEEFDEFWPEHSKISKICTLMGCFSLNYIMFELKKV